VMECNSFPDRLDLRDTHLRMAKDAGVKIVISTYAHSTANLALIDYGVRTARRGWIEPGDVINTLPCEKLLASLRPRPGSGGRHASEVAHPAPSGTPKKAQAGARQPRKK
jgi:hypothetical protein